VFKTIKNVFEVVFFTILPKIRYLQSTKKISNTAVVSFGNFNFWSKYSNCILWKYAVL